MGPTTPCWQIRIRHSRSSVAARPGIMNCVSSLIHNVGANFSDHIQEAPIANAATIIMNQGLGRFSVLCYV